MWFLTPALDPRRDRRRIVVATRQLGHERQLHKVALLWRNVSNARSRARSRAPTRTRARSRAPTRTPAPRTLQAHVDHLEPFTITLDPSSGEQLPPYSKVFFVPQGTATCPVQVDNSHGGFLDQDLSVQISLPATTSVFVLCLAPPYSDVAVMHTHIRVLVGYRSPSPPPPTPPPPSPSPPPPSP